MIVGGGVLGGVVDALQAILISLAVADEVVDEGRLRAVSHDDALAGTVAAQNPNAQAIFRGQSPNEFASTVLRLGD